jgi:polyphosphate glucokinase
VRRTRWTPPRSTRTIEERVQKPVRAANDAGVQGLGVIEGRGVEMVVTLGTGMGFGLYVDGRYVRNIELAADLWYSIRRHWCLEGQRAAALRTPS